MQNARRRGLKPGVSPQNAAWPKESSPVNPSRMSSAIANSAIAAMSIATGG